MYPVYLFAQKQGKKVLDFKLFQVNLHRLIEEVSNTELLYVQLKLVTETVAFSFRRTLNNFPPLIFEEVAFYSPQSTTSEI